MRRYKNILERFFSQHRGLQQFKDREQTFNAIQKLWREEIQKQCFGQVAIQAEPRSFINNILLLEYNNSTDLFYLQNMEAKICDILKEKVLRNTEFRILYSKQDPRS